MLFAGRILLRNCLRDSIDQACYANNSCGMSADIVRKVNFEDPIPRVGSVSSITSGDNGQSSRRRMSIVRSLNKEAVLALGEDLRQTLHDHFPGMVKDRRYHLKTYTNCAVGYELVTWLVDRKEAETRKEAVAIMQKLVDNGVIHHVCDDHGFKDEKLFYRFRRDDGTYAGPLDAPLVAKGQRIYSRVRTGAPGMISDRKYHLHSYKQCFVGSEFVDWLVEEGDVKDRDEAIEFGNKLLKANIIRHVCDDHDFKDEYLFYRFCNDERNKEKKLNLRKLLSNVSPIAKVDKSQAPTLPERRKSNKGGKLLKRESVYADPDEAVSSTSKAFIQTGEVVSSIEEEDEYMAMNPAGDEMTYVQMHSAVTQEGTIRNSIIPPPCNPCVNGVGTTFTNSPIAGRKTTTVDDLLLPDAPFVQREIKVVSDPVGYGFVIRGNNPVYVHSVDPMGPAAAAGLHVGEFLYSVNGNKVLHSSHQDAAKIILMGPNSTDLVTLCPRHLCQ